MRLDVLTMDRMPVEHLARGEVVTASPDDSVQDLANRMEEDNVGSIVITDGNEPVGIVTDRDLTLQIVGEGRDPGGVSAEDVMTTNLATVQTDEGFYEATQRMSEHAVRRLPVVNDSGELSGIITADDLNELLADEHQQLADVIQAQRPPY